MRNVYTSATGATSTWWRHQMETSPRYWTFVWEFTGEFPSQRPVTRSFDVSLIRTGINAWVNNREPDDLIRHRAHYDVILMMPVRVLQLCCVTDDKLITMDWCGSKRESTNGGNYPYDLKYNIYFSSSLFSPLCAAIYMPVSRLNMFYAHDMTWYPETCCRHMQPNFNQSHHNKATVTEVMDSTVCLIAWSGKWHKETKALNQR